MGVKVSNLIPSPGWKVPGFLGTLILFFIGISTPLFSQALPPEKVQNPPETFSSPRGFAKGQRWSVLGCAFVFPQDSVVERGEGGENQIFYRIYPRRGEDFFFTLRSLPASWDTEKLQEFFQNFEDQEFTVGGNQLILRKTYIPQAHLLLYQVVRKELPELLDFFLSCGKVFE